MVISIIYLNFTDPNFMKKSCLIIWLVFVNAIGYSQSYNGIIIRVIDGDTFVFQTLKGSFTVRMYGTDAPERDQTFSKETADFLKQYLNKDAVTKVNGTD